MKSNNPLRLVVVIAALSIVVLSFVFGPRHFGYVLVAALSATVIWGAVSFLGGRTRRWGIMVGVMLALIVQRTACHLLQAELPGLWWPLAQFGALHCLIADGIGRTVP